MTLAQESELIRYQKNFLCAKCGQRERYLMLEWCEPCLWVSVKEEQ